MPQVSVIIIFLNAERFIEEAIESVFAQTCRSWELLLVDDGSSDGSSQIAKRCAAKHPMKVRYLEHEGHRNCGMSASRNLGLTHALGQYVAFIDADDVWLPEKLEHQISIMEAHPHVGLVCGASRHWHGWTGYAQDIARDLTIQVGAPQESVVYPPNLALRLYPLSAGNAPCVASLLIRRSVAEAVGGFETSFQGILQRYEDQAFLAKVYLATPVFVSSACFDLYRRHENSCTAAGLPESDYHTARRFFLSWYERLLISRGERGSAQWHLLQQAIWPYRHPFAATLLRRGKRASSVMLRSLLPTQMYSTLRDQYRESSLLKLPS